MISYLQMVQIFAQTPQYYPPETVLQGIYGSPYYAMLESELAKENKAPELIDLTDKSFQKLVPYIRSFCPKGVFLDYDKSKYDPTIKFYRIVIDKEDELGFLDLPCYTFFYMISQEEADAKKRIEKIESRIEKYRNKEDEITNTYDYNQQQGATKILMRMSRRENYKEAQELLSLYDDKIAKQYELLRKAKNRLQKIQLDQDDRNSLITDISKNFAELGIPSSELEPRQEEEDNEMEGPDESE